MHYFEHFRTRMASMIKRAAITPDFLDLVQNRLKKFVVWKSPAFKGGKKYLSVIEIKDPQGEYGSYFYVQRMGKNSVAFICYDPTRVESEGRLLILRQWHGPLSTFVDGAFTGSLDKADKSVLEILAEEMIEEAGIHFDSLDILQTATSYKGAHPVSANTDELVHLFIVNVATATKSPIQPENIFEQNTRRLWTDRKYILSKCEWKANLILTLPDQPLPPNLV